MFFIIKIRLDLSFYIVVTTYFAKNHNHANTVVIKMFFCYFKRLIDHSFTYNGIRKNIFIKNYPNSDWAGDKESQKSILGFIFILNRGFISYCLKCQAILVFFSQNSEYVVFILALKEAI